MVIVMDAQWRPDYFLLGWSQETMAEVAANYYTLAESDPDVIALIGYLWPGGLDLPVQLGARELPPVVQDEYVSIGRSILGPPAECPVSGVRARGNESTTLTWTAVPGRPSAVYDVERGDLGTLAETAGRIELGTLTCIENDSPDTDSTSTPDTAVPSAGDGHFYLVRWQESPELGTRGKGSSGNPRVGTGGCSAVP
ncbi:MAG: hypothetical protein D6738_09095 [Acidobacteria bacterium]|nr:MAG: hypothetical protein D6738_09095 [Acidobacteriota bacterium]